MIDRPGLYQFNDYDICIKEHLPQTSYPLKVRARRNGDMFKLNGRNGHKN